MKTVGVERLGKSGRKPRNPEIEADLLRTFKDARSNGMLKTKAESGINISLIIENDKKIF